MYIYSNITVRICTLAIYYSLIRLYIVIEKSVHHQSMYAKYICNSNIQQYLVNSLYIDRRRGMCKADVIRKSTIFNTLISNKIKRSHSRLDGKLER